MFQSTVAGLAGVLRIPPVDIPALKLAPAPIQLHNTEELLVLVQQRRRTPMQLVPPMSPLFLFLQTPYLTAAQLPSHIVAPMDFTATYF